MAATLGSAYAQTDLALSGPAYILSRQAHEAYARGDYKEAAEKSREALRQRPDVKELQALLKKSEAARRTPVLALRRSGSTAPSAGPAGTPKPDPAFAAATSGYQAYDRREFSAAVGYAEQAVRLAPGNRSYHLLLVNALSAANRLADADAAITQALADTASQSGGEGELGILRERIREQMAQVPAAEAYAALERREFPVAVSSARAAIALAPTHLTYRMALIEALLQGELFDEAETAASEAIALGSGDPSPRVLRSYARQRLGRRADAVADLDQALQQPGVGVAAQRNIRLIAADAALAALEPQRALTLLQDLPQTGDAAVAVRRATARSALVRMESNMPLALSPASLVSPTLDCAKKDGPQLCAVLPGVSREPGFDAASAAYEAFNERRFAQATTDARKALQLSPENREYQLLLVNASVGAQQYAQAEAAASMALAADNSDAALIAQRGFIRQRLGLDALAREDFQRALDTGQLPVATEIGLLADLGRKAQARQRFDEALVTGRLVSLSDMDIAYLAAKVGDDVGALAAFNRADASGNLPATSYQDAAFSSLHAHSDAQAITFFKRAIDDAGTLALRMEPQLLFNTRRAVAEVSRETGLIASLSYRGAVSGLGLSPGVGTDSLQAGIEGYWRPWGYRDGRYLEFFARAFETLYSKGGGATGNATRQAAVGMRYKPFSTSNVIASISRIFTASGGRDDWLAQIGFSGASGGDLRIDAPAWWTMRISAEAGRYLEGHRSYALSEFQAGRSFRTGDSDSRMVLFPHVVLAVDYDSNATEKTAAGVGPGLAARYWFREDVYNAPRSYVDVSLQYRFRLTDAPRGKGVFLTTTLSY